MNRLWRLIVDDPLLAIMCVASVCVCFAMRQLGLSAGPTGGLLFVALAGSLWASLR